jgi:hypothetical protein
LQKTIERCSCPCSADCTVLMRSQSALAPARVAARRPAKSNTLSRLPRAIAALKRCNCDAAPSGLRSYGSSTSSWSKHLVLSNFTSHLLSKAGSTTFDLAHPLPLLMYQHHHLLDSNSDGASSYWNRLGIALVHCTISPVLLLCGWLPALPHNKPHLVSAEPRQHTHDKACLTCTTCNTRMLAFK